MEREKKRADLGENCMDLERERESSERKRAESTKRAKD